MMFLKDEKKKNPGCFFFEQKIKEEWKPKSSTSDADKPKIDKKGNNANLDIFKHQRTQGNKGNFEANKHNIFPSNQQTYLQKRIQTENFNVPHDELFSRNLEANLSNQTSIMNVNSSNLTPQFNYSSTSFPSHVHQTRGFHKKSNRGSNFQLSPETFETPVQTRVFSGYQESDTQINNLKATKIGRSQTQPNFYPGHNSEEIRFQQLHSQKAFSSGKSQVHKPINSTSQTTQSSEVDFSSRPRGFNMEPKNTFLSPKTSNPLLPNPSAAKLSNTLPVGRSKSSTPYSSQTHLNENSSTNAVVQNSSFETKNALLKSPPVYQNEKNFQNLGGKGNRPDLSQNEKTNKEIRTWVSSNTFQTIPVNTETGKVSHLNAPGRRRRFAPGEEDASASIYSPEANFWTADFPNNEISSFSDESKVTRDDFMISSIKSSEFTKNTGLKISSKDTGVISVFWDIENCPVPYGKSAVDFVKHVRTTLYENRTEGSFNVACDVHNLSNAQAHELHSSNVTVCHMSSTNKNAADAKLNCLLYEFLELYKGRTGCAIVLISGDSDFANILNTLRFRYNIYVNLICKNNAKHSLVEAAHRCVFYEDFIKMLPARSLADDIECLIIVSNFPKNMMTKLVKNALSYRLRSVNCKMKNINEISAEIVLPDDCARDRALQLLKNFEIGGNEIKTECSDKKKGDWISSKPINPKNKYTGEVKSTFDDKNFQSSSWNNAPNRLGYRKNN
ncbi:meiosis regulator and mRNA stability factor 1 [Caerostris darwini]|uniref:Meiosis regulator and mRNA stability factor 1 n=1 Tax=Caerostris darwini TaxID=1538125 RepID=A0AAV4QMG4_9ARAC|nr:meiosis regulator and mRNA stability factor 1 [Caerostris darwini]